MLVDGVRTALLGSSKIKRGRPPAINARPGKAQNRPYQMAARPATRANTKTKTRRPRTITAKIVPTDGIRATLEKASAFSVMLGRPPPTLRPSVWSVNLAGTKMKVRRLIGTIAMHAPEVTPSLTRGEIFATNVAKANTRRKMFVLIG